jgi:hypothetical protein
VVVVRLLVKINEGDIWIKLFTLSVEHDDPNVNRHPVDLNQRAIFIKFRFLHV